MLQALRPPSPYGDGRVSRPRIRSLKPDMWQDEKIGGLTRDARLLFIGLITMADDEGRLRGLPALILGHVFPYDDIAPRKLAAWMGEITDAGLATTYTVGVVPYVSLTGWGKHQVINKPTPSDVPPPVSITEDARSALAVVPEVSSPRAQASAPADRKGREGKGNPPSPQRGNRKRDQDRWEEAALDFALQNGVTGDRYEVMKAVRSFEAGGLVTFREHAARYSLEVAA